MTTEEKALALLNEVQGSTFTSLTRDSSAIEALCRAIEQHEAFRQEVSDAVEDTKLMVETHCDTEALALVSNRLNRFIIPKSKPDPLVEAMQDALKISASKMGVELTGYVVEQEAADNLRAALEARGLDIREKNDD